MTEEDEVALSCAINEGRVALDATNVAPYDSALFDEEESCSHVVASGPGGGVVCIYCPGWFCY